MINENIYSIIDWIEQEKCTLVLGPDIAYNCEKSLLHEFSTFLEKNKVEHHFNADEELFSSTTRFKPFVYQQLPKFFDNLQPSTIHQKIAETPFHFIISLSPDTLLKQTFDSHNFDRQFRFYYKGKTSADIEKPCKERPLLYNLMGVQTEFNSLVFCFNHLFDYLSSILGKFELPENLRTELKETQSIFFLGFKFDKWYFKLILRLLGIDENALHQASFKEVENMEGIVHFYTDEFKFAFLAELSGFDIIDQIHQHFLQKDALRKPKPEIQTAPQQVTNIINVTDSDDVTILQNVKAGDINLNRTK
jgi:hypothetical protein